MKTLLLGSVRRTPRCVLPTVVLGLAALLPAPAGAASPSGPASQTPSFRDRLQPAPVGSGFRQEGYFVWCGSAIKVGSTYHLFAARWPKETAFPNGYRTHSEIVRATAAHPLGPYTFQEVVIGRREPRFWDSNMAHNPTIHRIGDRYVLYYIGSDATTPMPGFPKLLARAIGYATASAITGPWTRCATPIIPADSNNPAVYVEPTGAIKLMYRDARLRIFLAVADSYAGPYRTLNDNVWPNSTLEDFYLFKTGGRYHVVCEDARGGISGHAKWGVHLTSANGIDGWTPTPDPIAYDHSIRFTDGSVLQCNRRERPQLLIEDGRVTHLITAVYDGTNTWSQPVPLWPPLRLQE